MRLSRFKSLNICIPAGFPWDICNYLNNRNRANLKKDLMQLEDLNLISILGIFWLAFGRDWEVGLKSGLVTLAT